MLASGALMLNTRRMYLAKDGNQISRTGKEEMDHFLCSEERLTKPKKACEEWINSKQWGNSLKQQTEMIAFEYAYGYTQKPSLKMKQKSNSRYVSKIICKMIHIS